MTEVEAYVRIYCFLRKMCKLIPNIQDMYLRACNMQNVHWSQNVIDKSIAWLHRTTATLI